MSRAAKQLREYLDDRYPGVRISRYACRDTLGGSVSQHSAKDWDEYDSNALDVMGAPNALGLSREATQAYLDVVYADVMAHAVEWSIRLVLWRVAGHEGHIHFDLWPTCLTHKWCGDPEVTPSWETSTGQRSIGRDPDPENGEYHGPTLEDDPMFTDWSNGLFDLMSDDEIVALYQAGFIMGDPDEYFTYFADLRDLGSEGRDEVQRAQVARFVQTSMVSAWLNTDRRINT
jgi:hypothetical protein